MPAIAITAITFQGAAYDALVIQATPMMSAGRNFVPRSAYRDIAVFGPEEELPVDFTPYYTPRFGALTAGKAIFVRMYTATITGFRGEPQERKVIVS